MGWNDDHMNTVADTEKHASCPNVITGWCKCGTCKHDHGQQGTKPPCCIEHYSWSNCPVVKCPHYEKEDATGKDDAE